MRWMAVVALVVTVLVNGLGAFRDFRDSREINDLAALTARPTQAGVVGADPVLRGFERQVTTWQIGGVLFGVAALAAVAAIVMLARRKNIVPVIGVLVVATVAATIASPGETGLWEGAAVRSIGYVAIASALAAGGLAFLVSRRRVAVAVAAKV